MENNKKKGIRSIFNLFDIVVIVLAIVLALVLYVSKSGGTEQVVADVQTIRYTIELTGMVNDSADLISAGDELVDKVKKYNIGTVESVEVSTTVVQANNMIDGTVITSEVPSQETARIVLTAEATSTDTQITVDGGYVIRVGLPVNVKGPGYWGTGYILSIDRSAE
jgi:hypothetical protein